MIRTFVDSGVLIAAARGDHTESEPALRLLENPERRRLTSVFVRLEVYPKTAFHVYALQRAFPNEFFMDPALEWVSDLNGLVNLAIRSQKGTVLRRWTHYMLQPLFYSVLMSS